MVPAVESDHFTDRVKLTVQAFMLYHENSFAQKQSYYGEDPPTAEVCETG